MMTENELVDLTMHLHWQTEKAIKVSDDGDEKRAVWLPLSQVEVEVLRENTVEVTVPTWLAKNKGLI